MAKFKIQPTSSGFIAISVIEQRNGVDVLTKQIVLTNSAAATVGKKLIALSEYTAAEAAQAAGPDLNDPAFDLDDPDPQDQP